MRRWRRPSPTRGTWTATTCGAPAGSTRPSRSSPRPTRSKRRTSRRRRFRSSTIGTTSTTSICWRRRISTSARCGRPRRCSSASFAIPSSLLVQEFNKREWPVFLLARGRAQEALAAANTMAAHRSPVVSAAGHVEAGRARLALGQFKEAADEGNTALRLMRGAEGGGIVADALQALQGEFLLRTGKAAQGRPMLEEVVRKARARPGPDAWAQALFTIEAIARAAREVGDWELAGWAARQMLEHDPNYAGSHEALALVAEHRGDAPTARAERALAAKYWKNADPDAEEVGRVLSDPADGGERHDEDERTDGGGRRDRDARVGVVASAGAAQAKVDVTGKWAFNVETVGRRRRADVHLQAGRREAHRPLRRHVRRGRSHRHGEGRRHHLLVHGRRAGQRRSRRPTPARSTRTR